jgi:tetratricopeptide (TPR) repeat protein
VQTPLDLNHVVELINTQKYIEAESLLKMTSNKEPNIFYLLAYIHNALGQTDIAISELEHLISNNFSPPMVRMLLARCYFAKSSIADLATARIHLKKVLEEDIQNVEAHVLYGHACWSAAQIDDATESLKMAIKLCPTHTRAHWLIAQVYGQEGHLEEAAFHLQTASELDHKTAEIVKLDLEDLNKTLIARKKTKSRKIIKSRYPNTHTMQCDFDSFFDKEFGKYVSNVPRFIHKDSKFLTMGSCFAREIARFMQDQGLQTKWLDVSESVNTTFANKCLVDWLKGCENSQASQRIEELFAGRDSRESITQVMRDVDAFVFTLGVAPAFFDRATKEFIMPRPSAINTHALAEKYSYETTSIDANLDNILYVIDYIKTINENAYIFLTLSPVPIGMTFEYESAMVADCVSKSVLRVAADLDIMSASKIKKRLAPC